ncbi:MAG: carboxypeptidase-like regulatory domain-containing protein [Actinomycetota bacterium]|nr:carboxypeptidase-like regulatory domain-containing protein [Actinomycetota bacterium]
MRRLILLPALSLLLLAAPAGAAERGSITGRILNGTTGRPEGNVRVQLLGVTRDRSDQLRRSVVTGRDGRYSFKNLEAGRRWLYVLDARYDGGLFPGRPLSIPGNTRRPPVIGSKLRVWETTTDPNTVLIERDNLFAVVAEEFVEVVESVTVVNRTDRAYIGRGEVSSAGTSSTFGFPLPQAADTNSVRIEGATMDVPTVLRTSFGFAVTVAIPPGESRFTYSYRVTGSTGTWELSRTALYPTLELSAFVEDPLEIQSPRLTRRDSVDIGERTYRRWTSTEALDAGDAVQMSAVAKGSPPWPVFAGGGAGVVVLLGALYLAARRRRTESDEEDVSDAPSATPEHARDDLVTAIARLDLQFEAGELARDEWERRRVVLKSALEEMSRVG